MKHSFLFTVVFLCISLGYIFPQNNTYKNIIGKINTITEENSKVQIDVQIPEVKDSIINAELNKLIKSQIINFEKENFPPGKEKPFLRMLAGYSGFKDRIVTFIFKTSISAGENNSMEFLIPFSFDIKNKKQIFLSDIFRDSLYLKTISKIVIKKAKEIYKKDDPELKTFIPNGLLPKPENFPSYYFDEDGIMFNFSPLQIGTMAGTDYRIKVLFSELKKILKDSKNIVN